ncbi:MAG: hypothetical protein KGH55_01355 [Nanoarchaeota archaeon]|nr:hypothetical protein [Nanoarchaeota archaeon]
MYLDNGYTAESLTVKSELDFITAVHLGYIKLEKAENGEMIAKSSYNTFGKKWKGEFDKVCNITDKTKDKVISASEAHNELTLTNKVLFGYQ